MWRPGPRRRIVDAMGRLAAQGPRRTCGVSPGPQGGHGHTQGVISRKPPFHYAEAPTRAITARTNSPILIQKNSEPPPDARNLRGLGNEDDFRVLAGGG